MSNASLSISVIAKRMFNMTEAASYTGLPVKHFKAICPVQPIELRRGKALFDKFDLDTWIDGEKTGTEMTSQDAILKRL